MSNQKLKKLSIIGQGGSHLPADIFLLVFFKKSLVKNNILW